jgi:ABC-type Fe3+/spermidine/putrescine transport system ATPase subunit
MSAAVELRAVRKAYDGHVAVDELSLRCPPVDLRPLGPNGWKTT